MHHAQAPIRGASEARCPTAVGSADISPDRACWTSPGTGRHRRLSSCFMSKTALMCPPTFFDVREAKNPYMGSPIDHAKAQRQWEDLRRALQDSGLKVEIIDPVKDLDDMVFAANQVFVGRHHLLGNFIVPSRMRFPSRHKE